MPPRGRATHFGNHYLSLAFRYMWLYAVICVAFCTYYFLNLCSKLTLCPSPFSFCQLGCFVQCSGFCKAQILYKKTESHWTIKSTILYYTKLNVNMNAHLSYTTNSIPTFLFNLTLLQSSGISVKSNQKESSHSFLIEAAFMCGCLNADTVLLFKM